MDLTCFFRSCGLQQRHQRPQPVTPFQRRCERVAPPIQFTANRRPYNMAYYLADGIYPKWPVFISSPTAATDPKVQLFKAKQESARKDVKRAFGVLKMRWGIIQGPSRLYFRDHMQDVMYACIIMHNMIIENEGPMVTQWAPPEDKLLPATGLQWSEKVRHPFVSMLNAHSLCAIRSVTKTSSTI